MAKKDFGSGKNIEIKCKTFTEINGQIIIKKRE